MICEIYAFSAPFGHRSILKPQRKLQTHRGTCKCLFSILIMGIQRSCLEIDFYKNNHLYRSWYMVAIYPVVCVNHTYSASLMVH